MNTPGNERELIASNNYVTAEQAARMGWHPIDQVPAIFFAKVGAAVMLNRKRLVNKPFLLDNNTMAFSMNSSLLDMQFGQSLFERLDLTSLIQVGALPSYNSSDVEGISVSLPSTMDEQRQIGQYLCDLNTLITLHQRKRRNGSFTHPLAWEQRKLGEITERYKELVATPQDGYTRMGVRSHAKGTFLAEVEPGQQIEERELSKVRANNLVVNIVFAWEHAVAITTEKDAKALVSHRFPQFSFHDDMEPDFFRYATLDPDFKNHLWLASPSGAGRNKTLNIKTMLEYKFDIPLRSEQARIAVFFQHLDSLITLHQ